MVKKNFYLKLLMSLLLVALAVPQVMADEVTLFSGTSTNAYAPVHSSYLDGVGSTYQVIYPATGLEDLVGSNITGVKFYASGNLNFTGGSLKVSVGETTNTSFSSATPITGLDEVATTAVSSTNDEFVLNFDNEYSYNGGNLVIEIKVLTAVTLNGYSAMDWYGVSATGNNVYHADAGYGGSTGLNSWIPKTTFIYEDATPTPYKVKVNPSSLSFGKTMIGSNPSLSVVLSNKGSEALPYSISGLSDPFNTSVTSGTVAVGSELSIPVTFAPSAVESYSGEMIISFPGTDLENVTVPVTGAGTNDICDGGEESDFLPVWGYWFDQAQVNQMLYPASKLGALNGKKLTKLTFYPKEGIKFYSNSSSTASTVIVKLANVDSGTTFSYPLEPEKTTVKTITLPTSAQSSITEWVFEFDETFDYTGGDLLVEVVTTAGKFGATTFYGENQSATSSYYKRSGANATASNFLPKVTFAYEDSETPATPVITTTTETLTYETVVGTSKFSTFGVTGENLTEGITATISGENASYFSVTPATLGTEGGTLRVDYDPAAAGNHTATLTLSSAGAEDVVIPINAIATADYAVTVNPENGYDFGNVLVDNTKVWTLTITNNGLQSVTPTLTGLEAPFSTTYTAAPLAAGESVSIEITFAPTAVEDYSNAITLSFPEANGAIASYTYELTGKGVDSFEPTAENEVVKLITVDKRSIYEPNFIDEANNNTTPQQLNCYDMRFKMAQPDDPAKQIKAGDLHPGNNLYEFYAIDDFGTEFRFATINLYAEGQPSSNPSVSAMDAPIKVTPSIEYYTEDGMPVHPDHTHYTTLNYTEKTYNDINELVDLEGVIDYVNDTWSANTATNSHPDHYKFQIRGVGQFGDLVTSLTSEYVEGHMTGYGNSLVLPEGWERGSWVGPNNEIDGVHSYYYYDLYIKRSFFDERGITGPVTVVVNTTLSGSGFNADNYKAMSVNGVEQIIAKEAFKDYSWTVPLGNDLPENSVVEQVPMGVVIRLVSTGADFNRTTGIYIYGGGTGVSNIDTVGIYKSSMNVKAYTQKQVDEDTDRNLVAMNSSTGVKSDVNVLAYGDPAVTGYVLYENGSASTTGMTQVATANHETDGDYSVNSTGTYNGRYDYIRDESLGNIDGMWLPMYPADAQMYYLPVTYANGVGDDGVVRSENNTYGSAMQQVEDNGSVAFGSSKCYKSTYTWVKNGVEYAIYNPEVDLTSQLPAETGYQLYNYRLWVDYDENAPAWDFDENLQLIGLMDRPLYSGQDTHIGGTGAQERKDSWAFVAPADLNKVKLVARFYYKKNSTGKARPTDKDRLYYVVENQVEIPTNQIITGIDNVSSKAVANVKYYNMMGIESDVPFQGVNIEVTTYEDGSRTTRKIMK